jgi:hypothetical protein
MQFLEGNAKTAAVMIAALTTMDDSLTAEVIVDNIRDLGLTKDEDAIDYDRLREDVQKGLNDLIVHTKFNYSDIDAELNEYTATPFPQDDAEGINDEVGVILKDIALSLHTVIEKLS